MSKGKTITVAIVIMILAGGALVANISFNKALADKLTKETEAATQTKVTFDDVYVSPFTGKGYITNLKIGNPKGFKTDHSFLMKRVLVDMDVSSWKSKVIIVNEVKILDADVNYEAAFLTGSNIAIIMKNFKAYWYGGTGDGTTMLIKQFTMEKGTMHIGNPLLKETAIPIELSKIEVQDIGDSNAEHDVMETVTASILNDIKAAVNTALTTPPPSENTPQQPATDGK